MKTAAAILPLVLQTACATAAPPLSSAAGFEILHYVRSNGDGSQPENVVHYRPDRRSIAVYKWVTKCTTAAYVTARMNEDVSEGQVFIAGKVAPDGSQAAFGTLTLNPRASTLMVDLAPAGAPPIQEQHQLRSRPYLLYDFDFADLNAFLQEAKPRSSFSYELPVIWPDKGSIFRDLGRLHAEFAEEGHYRGRRGRHFELRLDGPTPATGDLWVDALDGFIIEARLGLPNHPGYDDFKLSLNRVQKGSDAAWAALMRSHYAGCEPKS